MVSDEIGNSGICFKIRNNELTKISSVRELECSVKWVGEVVQRYKMKWDC